MNKILPVVLTAFLLFSCGNNVHQKTMNKTYWKNGQVKSEEKIGSDGKRNGEANYYFENGTVSRTAVFLNDSLNGLVRNFYPSGKLKESFLFVNGKKDGATMTCYDNGKISSKGLYKTGKKEGYFSSYRLDGSLELVTIYENDLETGFIEYDEAGKVSRSSVSIQMKFLETKNFSAGKAIPIELTVTNSYSRLNSDSLVATAWIRNGNDSVSYRFPLTKDSTWIYNYIPKVAGKYFITASVSDYIHDKPGIIFRSKQQAEFIVKD